MTAIQMLQPGRSRFGNNVYVVGGKDPYGPYRIMLTSSNDGGDTFHKPIMISENAMAQTFPKNNSF